MLREISRPQEGEYNSYFQRYIDKVKGNPIQALEDQLEYYLEYIKTNSDRMDYRYAEGKWSIRESLMHVIDTEQIFAYRALRISRGDKTALAGFDQDDYIANSNFDHISPSDLIELFTNQRQNTISMMKRFTEEQLKNLGVASGSDTSVRALVYMTAGHAQHHIDIFEERYA
ncbi:MAG: DinB family protein [Bacteroidota bacterium]